MSVASVVSSLRRAKEPVAPLNDSIRLDYTTRARSISASGRLGISFRRLFFSRAGTFLKRKITVTVQKISSTIVFRKLMS